jgi:hypothetical protein
MATRFLNKVNSLSDIQNLVGASGVGVHGGIPYIRSDAGLMPLDTSKLLNPPIFVAGNAIGSDSNDGLSWQKPYLTMQKAFNNVESGGVIYFRGNIREQIDTPAGVFDVTVIGHGNRPRHADAHTANGGYSANTWKAPASPASATPLVRVRQQGWRFVNILFAGPSDEACVKLFRDSGSGDDERDASHAEFTGCRFASGQDGISDTGGCYGVLVQSCRFLAMTGYAILGVGNIGVGQSDWWIRDNQIEGCTNGIKIAGFQCRIQNNFFDDGGTPNSTVVLNVSNGGGDNNFVVDNFFQVATANFNTPDVVGNATDVWFNVSIDSFTAGLESGHEVGQPA